MTPSGVHVNKTAIAVIIGILILIVIGFKYKGGAIVSFDEKGNKGVDLKKEKEREEILKTKEEEKLKIKEEFKKEEEELIKQNEEKLKKKGEELKKKEEELKKKDREELKKKERRTKSSSYK